MRFLLRPASAWTLCNGAGMTGYLSLASTLWVRPGEEGVPGRPGDKFYWLVCLAPVLALFFALDAAALFFVVRQIKQTGRKGALVLWLGVVLLWVGTAALDQHKAFRHVELPLDPP